MEPFGAMTDGELIWVGAIVAVGVVVVLWVTVPIIWDVYTYHRDRRIRRLVRAEVAAYLDAHPEPKPSFWAWWLS